MQKDKPNKFTKKERINSLIRIEMLFKLGTSFFVFPLRIVVNASPSTNSGSVSILISVSKRTQKKAVNRNRVKRLIREAYRTQKSSITQYAIQNHLNIEIAFIFTQKIIPDYTTLAHKVGNALHLIPFKLKIKPNNETEIPEISQTDFISGEQ